MLEGSDNVKEAEGEGQGEGLSEAEQKALLRMSLEEVCVCLSVCLSISVHVPCESVRVCVWSLYPAVCLTLARVGEGHG